jgi:hypothetical protein
VRHKIDESFQSPRRYQRTWKRPLLFISVAGHGVKFPHAFPSRGKGSLTEAAACDEIREAIRSNQLASRIPEDQVRKAITDPAQSRLMTCSTTSFAKDAHNRNQRSKLQAKQREIDGGCRGVEVHRPAFEGLDFR